MHKTITFCTSDGDIDGYRPIIKIKPDGGNWTDITPGMPSNGTAVDILCWDYCIITLLTFESRSGNATINVTIFDNTHIMVDSTVQFKIFTTTVVNGSTQPPPANSDATEPTLVTSTSEGTAAPTPGKTSAPTPTTTTDDKKGSEKVDTGAQTSSSFTSSNLSAFFLGAGIAAIIVGLIFSVVLVIVIKRKCAKKYDVDAEKPVVQNSLEIPPRSSLTDSGVHSPGINEEGFTAIHDTSNTELTTQGRE